MSYLSYYLNSKVGDYQSGLVNTIVEIPQGSILKIEWDRHRNIFILDRVEPQIFAKPVNYGFIPQTLDEDGDELDTLVVCDAPIPTGVQLEAKIIGVLNFEDDGEMDYKIVVVPADDRNTGDSIHSLDDLGERWKQKIEHHFSHYKDLKKPGTTKVLGWGDAEAAKKVIQESIERWNKEIETKAAEQRANMHKAGFSDDILSDPLHQPLGGEAEGKIEGEDEIADSNNPDSETKAD